MPVFAAGNDGPECATVGSPAGRPDAVAIGALAQDRSFDQRTSRGPGPEGTAKPDVWAPGLGIISTLPDGAYGTGDGTSMAAPHVAGALAVALGDSRDTEDLAALSVETGSTLDDANVRDLGRVDVEHHGSARSGDDAGRGGPDRCDPAVAFSSTATNRRGRSCLVNQIDRRRFMAGMGAAAGGLALGACGDDDDGSAAVRDESGGGLSSESSTVADPLDTFDHVVVVMFENRSFDNLLGSLYGSPGQPQADFDGVFVDGTPGTRSNPGPDGTGTVFATLTTEGISPSVDPGSAGPT